jgi:hypothetical protein
MKPFVFLVVGLLLLPFVLSFDCSSVSDSSYCLDIQSSSLLDSEKELVYATLLYDNITYPDHSFVEEYNQNINFNSPSYSSEIASSSYIKDAWLSFAYMSPSVYVNETLLVPPVTSSVSHYNYRVETPSNYRAWWYPNHNSYGDCRTTYNLIQNDATQKYYVDSVEQSNPLIITEDSTIESELSISTTIQQKHYWWQRNCRYCVPRCRYHHSYYLTDAVILSQEKDVELYDSLPSIDVSVVNQYSDTTQGEITAEDVSTYSITFPESTLIHQEISYSVIFEEEPFHIAVLTAYETPVTYVNNLILDDELFYVNNINTCVVNSYNHFSEIEEDCGIINTSTVPDPYENNQQDISLSLLWYVLTFCLVVYILFKIIKTQFGKIILPVLLMILILPTSVLADSCSITNITSCLPEVLMEYVLYVINLPISSLLTLVESLLTADVSIELFESLWSVIRYIISVFYLFFILYAGVTLVVGSASPIKRAHAKEMLQNGIFMMILVQGSFYLYDLLTTLGANMSNALLSQVDPVFFLLTIDSMTNIGLQFLFGMFYVIALLCTVLLLVLRYIVVSVGVVFFPVGIFLFFVPPLKGFGRIILNTLGILIFITFFDMLIILASSMLLDIALFTDFKILVMIVCFATICGTLLFSFIYSIKEATTTGLRDSVSKAVKYVGLLFI